MHSPSSPPPGALLALFGLSSLITGLDFTIVYVALPDIARDLGFSPHGLQWVISAYAIAFGGSLLLAGRLSDLLGRGRMFLAGMALFSGGSLLGGMAATPGLLIGARIVQGLGAAALFPSTLALVNTTFAEGRRRDRALGLWAAAGAAGLSLGALLGGVLTEVVGWRGVFFVNLPLTLLGVIGAVTLLAGDRPRERDSRAFDLPGALTATAGTSLLVFATAQGPELGWTSTPVLAAVLAAVTLLAAFAAIEASAPRPLLPLRLLRNAALGVIFVFGLTLNSIPYVLTQYFQAVLGLGALQAGLGFLLPTCDDHRGQPPRRAAGRSLRRARCPGRRRERRRRRVHVAHPCHDRRRGDLPSCRVWRSRSAWVSRSAAMFRGRIEGRTASASADHVADWPPAHCRSGRPPGGACLVGIATADVGSDASQATIADGLRTASRDRRRRTRGDPGGPRTPPARRAGKRERSAGPVDRPA